MIEKAEVYFHVLLFALVVGMIIYVTVFGAPAGVRHGHCIKFGARIDHRCADFH
jgi:hypothetical protein